MSDKPVSFVKLFDNKTRTALMQKINEVKENAVNIVAQFKVDTPIKWC